MPCYRTQIIEQICADGEGRVRYFSYKEGGDALVALEATSMSTTVEPFSWPSGAFATPTGEHPAERSVAELQLPAIFHVGG